MKQRNKNKLVFGVGINDSDYKISRSEKINGITKIVWSCPFYKRWAKILERCYSSKWLAKYPFYTGCSVSQEWLTFSNFKAWMEQQDWEGKQLDKDLLVKDNKVYSSGTCVFVSAAVNSFLIDQKPSRGEFAIGVYFEKSKQRFRAMCSVVGTCKNKALGSFKTEIEAHKAWLNFKLEQAYELAAEQTDKRIAKALIDKYENYTPE